MAQAPEGKGRDWKNDELPSVGKSQVQDRVKNLKVHTSMGPDEIHPWVWILDILITYFKSLK